MDYIREKCRVLKELGLTNTSALKAYFKAETKDITDEAKRENKIDRLARDLINNYYDGDRSFVGYKLNSRYLV